MNRARQIGETVQELLNSGARRITAFIGPNETIQATNQGKPDGRTRNRTILVTIGKPNWAARQYIARCKRNGVRPVLLVQGYRG